VLGGREKRKETTQKKKILATWRKEKPHRGVVRSTKKGDQDALRKVRGK